MTSPVAGKLKVQVVGDVPAKFAGDLAHDLNAALRNVHVDTGPIADKISKGAQDGAARSGRALDGLASDINATFGEISRSADRAFDHVAGEAAQAATKVGTRFEVAGEVSERALSELDRTAGREFQQIANKATASAAATSTRWVAAWSIIKGAALAASTATVAGLTALTGFGLKAAAALEQTQIGMESLLGSADQAKTFLTELQKFSAATPFEFADVSDAARRILAFGSSVGIARAQVIPTLTTIGDLVSVLGGTAENSKSVIRALGQIASKGKLSQEEILQLAEALPGFNANAAIAASLGLSVADTLKLITAGGVSAKVGIDALLKGMAQFPGAAGAMAKQSQTLTGVFSTFKDTISIALSDAFTPVIPGIKDSLAKITPVIGQAISVLAPALGEFLTKLLPIMSAAIAAISPLLGIFTDLAGTILTALSPGLVALSGVATRLVEALSPLAVMIGEFLGKALEELVNSGALDEIITQLGDLVPAAIDLLIALLPLLPVIADLLTLFLRMQRPGIQFLALMTSLLSTKGVGPALGAVADAAGRLFKIFDKASQVTTDVREWPKLFSAFADKLGPIFSKAWAAVSTFFNGVGDWFAALPGRVGRFLASLPGVLVGAIGAALAAALHAVGFGIGLIIGEFLALPGLAAEAIARLPETLAFVWTAITTAAEAGLTAIVDGFKAVGGLILAGILGIPATIGAVFGAAKDVVLRDINAILAFAFSIPDRIVALVPQMVAAGLALIKGLFSGLSQAGGFVGDLASSITSAIKGLLNRVIRSINDGIASVDDALPGISLPRLPSLATGGLTTDGGLANLHPSELVLPLEDRRVVDLLARAMSAAVAGGVGGTAGPVGAGTPDFDVRVFIGETELKGMIDVQISERNRTTRGRVQAGSGARR